MRPARKGDGTGLSFPGYSEVRKGDGTVLWSARADRPDSEDLRAHYDASDKTDLSSLWPAEVGADLSAVGSPSVKTNEKNGLNVASYDGTGDGHSTAFSSPEPQPNHIFIVYRHTTAPGGSEYLMGSTSQSSSHEAGDVTGSDDFQIQTEANDAVSGHALDTNWHIVSMLFDGGNSVIRTDGAQTGSGTLSNNDDSGISLGWLEWNDGNHVEVDIGEVLYYGTDKSAIVSDIESDLNDKWAVY